MIWGLSTISVNIEKDEEKILAIDEALAELFYPTQACTRQNHGCCVWLAERVTIRVCREMMDHKKALHYHLSAADGKFSLKLTTEWYTKER